MDTYFISDIHGYHENIAGPKTSKWKDGYRDFESVDEMNEILTSNINKIVKRDDLLIYGGDFVFGMNKRENALKLRSMIHCRRIWSSRGNHDKPIWKDDLLPLLFERWYDCLEVNLNGQDFWLCHYCPEEYYSRENPHHVSFTRENRKTNFSDSSYIRKENVIHAFGHYHNSIRHKGLAIDTGVDVEIPEINHKKYTPFHIDEITSYLRSRK